MEFVLGVVIVLSIALLVRKIRSRLKPRQHQTGDDLQNEAEDVVTIILPTIRNDK